MKNVQKSFTIYLSPVCVNSDHKANGFGGESQEGWGRDSGREDNKSEGGPRGEEDT